MDKKWVITKQKKFRDGKYRTFYAGQHEFANAWFPKGHRKVRKFLTEELAIEYSKERKLKNAKVFTQTPSK